jgi:hypothetical protein
VKLIILIAQITLVISLSGCATTTGQSGKMIVDSVKQGDIVTAGIGMLALPGSLIIDVFTLGRGIGGSKRNSDSDRAFAADANTNAFWFNTRQGCKVADEWNLKTTDYDWTGSCSGGFVDGCGTLTRYPGSTIVWSMTGCFSQGKKNGEFTELTTDIIYKKIYKDGQILKHLEATERPGQQERDAARAKAYAAQLAKDAEDNKQAMAALTGALGAAAGGQTKNERLRLASESLNQSVYGLTPSGGAAASTFPGGATNSKIEIAGSMKNCLKIVSAGEDPSVDMRNRHDGLEKAFVIVNKCNEDIQFEFCQITGEKNYLDGKVTESKHGCEELYGGSFIARSGKVPTDIQWDRHPSVAYNWFDRTLIYEPRSWFVCNAKTEQIRLINQYGRTLEGNRACIPRRGNPYISIYPVEKMVPAGD